MTICSTDVLWTKPTLSRFVYFKLATAVPVLAAVVAIARYADSPWWLAGYFALLGTHVVIAYRIKCTHCTYYQAPGKTHSCFIFWRTPKVFKPRPEPASPRVKIYVPIAMAVMTFYPVYWLVSQWELLAIYALSWFVLVGGIAMNACTRCTYFDCGNNTVPESIRSVHRGPASGPSAGGAR